VPATQDEIPAENCRSGRLFALGTPAGLPAKCLAPELIAADCKQWGRPEFRKGKRINEIHPWHTQSSRNPRE
jgi:hypothetical protein